MVYLLLFVVGAVGAPTLVWYSGSEASKVAASMWGGAGLATAYMGWRTFYHARVKAAREMNLNALADELARVVRKQWDDEAVGRQVYDPPLPVAWRAADADLVEPWPLLADSAQAWPGGPPGDPAYWSVDSAGLEGSDAQIGEVFTQRVPTRRLVVLGEAGAGKSVLLIRLLQDLIERRSAGGLVPVLFSLASWDPAHQPLEGWIADQLRRNYPDLRSPVHGLAASARGGAQVDLAQALLSNRLILPLLDGFDELPSTLHALALEALNNLPAKLPLVLASRAAEYRAVLTRPDAMVRLKGAAGIHLLPVGRNQAAAYLRRTAGGAHTPAADRWNTVVAHLGTDSPVGQALATPLGLFLARAIYNPRSQTTPEPVPHPDELCDITAFPNRMAIDTHLFNAFIPAAYTPHGHNPLRWSASEAHRFLSFLARHLEADRGGSSDLAWWELHHALPVPTRRLTCGLAVGLGFALAQGGTLGLKFGLRWDVVVLWLAAGFAGGVTGILLSELVRRRPPSVPSTSLRWSFDGATTFELGTGFGFAVLVGLGFWLAAGPKVGLALGLGELLAFLLLRGLSTRTPDLTIATGPTMLLTQDRRTFLMIGSLNGLAIGFLGGLAVTFLSPGAVGALAYGAALLYGVALALTSGLLVGIMRTAWADFAMARTYLAVCGKVPWGLMRFLEDAHKHRGVLRQVGVVYQFRHIELQRHLAQQSWPPTI
ncbi:NACHT domain-containing protein [Streptomyces sp. NPDC002088]|uniref:NACHT domain-containing protein n=1 Tax=Streptomyces sp. NPDC002088 TaxID=3154665 RepID=UPI00331903F3